MLRKKLHLTSLWRHLDGILDEIIDDMGEFCVEIYGRHIFADRELNTFVFGSVVIVPTIKSSDNQGLREGIGLTVYECYEVEMIIDESFQILPAIKDISCIFCDYAILMGRE